MLKAKFKKKWVFGNPDKVKLEQNDWFRWLRFVNIVADDHGPGTYILTEWDDQNNLYGFSEVVFNEEGIPTDQIAITNIAGVKRAMMDAQAEDWRIETHQDLLPLARRIITWIERQEERHRDKEQKIREILSPYSRTR